MRKLPSLFLIGGSIITAGLVKLEPAAAHGGASASSIQQFHQETQDLVNQHTSSVGSSIISAVQDYGCDCGTISRLHNETRTAVNQHTTEVGEAIAQTILQSTQQVSAYLDRQVYANERFANARMQDDARRLRDQFRAEAESGMFDPAASACVTLAAQLALSAAPDEGSLAPVNGQDVTNMARNYARGVGDRGEEVLEGITGIATGMMDDRDTLSGLNDYLDPTTDIRLLTRDPTLDTSDPDTGAALARLRQNLYDPTPPRPLTDDQLSTPAGMTEFARRQNRDAQLSVVNDVQEFVESLSTPVSADLADHVRANAPAHYPHDIGERVSMRQYLDVEVARRFRNPEWHTQVAAMSPDAVQREQLLVDALRLEMEWLAFDFEIRRGLTDAVATSNSIPSAHESDPTN